MKILQLCNKVPFPPRDGGSIAIYNISCGLSQEGHQVFILAMETPKHPINKRISKISEGISLESVFVDTTIIKLDLYLNLLFDRIPYNAKRFINESYTNKLIEILTSEKFDIIQLEGLYLVPYMPVIRKHSEAKIAYRSHNIECEIWERLFKNEKAWFKKFYLGILAKRIKKLELKNINKYDVLIPITYRDAVEYQKFGNTMPSKVIQTGIPVEDIAEKITVRNTRRLYFLGSLDWAPNQEGILWFVKNIWPLITLSNSHIEFHVAGRNAPEWFAKQIDRPGIIFHGEIEDAKTFVNEYDIMIVPLLSGGGMRVKIVEAMAQGKIVVTTQIGAEGLDIIPNYHAIVTDEPELFAKGVQILLENTDFFVRLGNNSIRFIRNNYTNKALAKELAAFYQANL